MPAILHPVAGSLALLTILAFWVSTVIAELSGDSATIAIVKQAIPWGFLLLIPAMAITGASGFRMTRSMAEPPPLVRVKMRRMPFIAGNGILILVPSALYLAQAAGKGDFDNSFVWVQGLELVAGFVNIILLGLNMRDGLRLSRRFG